MAQQIDLSGNDIVVGNIYSGASTPGAAGTIVASSDLSGITPGTVTASKAVVVDSSKNASIFGTVGITNLNVGADAVAGTLAVYPTTTATGKTTFTASSNSGATITNINTAAQAAARTLTVPDAGASTANFVLSTGTSTATTATSTELNTISGVTPGTVIASKAVVTDSGTKVNGLLNATFGAGTATVAPINLTAGTNLTTATAGAVEFDGTAFYATSTASARQQVDGEQYIVAAANSTTYSNAGLDASTAYQVFTSTTNSTLSTGALSLAAGKTYFFEFMYNLTNTGTTSHTWSTVLGGSASFSAGSGYAVTGVTGTTASTPATGSLSGFIASTTLSTAVVVTAASTSATEQVSITGLGTLVINAGGTVIPQLKASSRPGASGTPGVTLLAGSFFRVWEMGSASNVGNWA